MRIGILCLGRPTFDVPYANEKLAQMLAALDATRHDIIGPRELLFDADATRHAFGTLQEAAIDRLLLLQVTFTDTSMTVAAASAFDVPLSIWAVPEPRLGGRLRLNAFCGLNLASHALGLNKRGFSWLYADPETDVSESLDALLSGKKTAGTLTAKPSRQFASAEGEEIVGRINGMRVGRIGEHPVGFDTCAYSARELEAMSGVMVDEIALDDLFAAARALPDEQAARIRTLAQSALHNLESVDQDELDKSLRLKGALDNLRAEGGYDAFAIRCWPETFTEYGGAVCGPIAMMGEARVPCACEADVYGALTQLVLQEVAQAPVFLADLVDLDCDDDTGVIWHCGQAPMSMRDPKTPADATIHTNRKMPLLYEFPLKAGRVTFMRISQAFGETKMVLAGGEVLERPMAFTGTSGVVRYDRAASDMLTDIMSSGLEHHMALAYGEHRPLLRAVSAAMNLPVLEL